MATDLGKQAKEAVLRQLALAHDHWSEEEQLLAAQGHPIEAEGAHQMALLCLQTYRRELNNPKPPKEPE